MRMARTEPNRFGHRPRGLTGRIALYVVLVLAALTCIGVQLDYAVEGRPELARLVYPPFEGLSHSVAAEQALAAEMKKASLREARALALARPAASESFSRLARAYALNGEAELAQQAIYASAARGWRDPLAQLVILQAAISVEDWDVIAQRLTALRKMRRDHEFFDQTLVELASVERGRKELAAQLAVDPMGQRQFMRDGLSLLPAEYFADILVASAASQEDLNCETFNLATERLLRAGDRQNALKVWLEDCRPSSDSALGEMGFQRQLEGAVADPFAWRYPRSSGVSNFPAAGTGGDPVLQFANNSRLNKVLAERFLLLSQGIHSIQIQRADPERIAGGRKSKITPLVQCMGSVRTKLNVLATDSGWTVEVPETGCDVQKVQLLATPGRDIIEVIRVSS